MKVDFPSSEFLSIAPTPLAKYIADHMSVGVSIESSDTGVVLSWTDFVANEWAEEYDNLSEVLLRLAVLVRCGEENWVLGFTKQPTEFRKSALQFFADEVR